MKSNVYVNVEPTVQQSWISTRGRVKILGAILTVGLVVAMGAAAASKTNSAIFSAPNPKLALEKADGNAITDNLVSQPVPSRDGSVIVASDFNGKSSTYKNVYSWRLVSNANTCSYHCNPQWTKLATITVPARSQETRYTVSFVLNGYCPYFTSTWQAAANIRGTADNGGSNEVQAKTTVKYHSSVSATQVGYTASGKSLVVDYYYIPPNQCTLLGAAFGLTQIQVVIG